MKQSAAVRRLPRRPWPLLVGVAATIALAVSTYQFAGRAAHTEQMDIMADWLVTRAAVLGHDPYADPLELAERYGVPYTYKLTDQLVEGEVSHPRTPGALVVMSPLAALTADQLFEFATVTTVLFVAGVITAWCLALGLAAWWAPILLLIVLWTDPFVTALYYTSQGAFVAALVSFTILRVRRGESRVAGFTLAAASVLKVFPLLLVLPLALRRRRTAAWTIAFTGLLNLVGLLLPGVSLGRAISALSEAGSNWMLLSHNGSAARLLITMGIPLESAPLTGALLVTGGTIALLVPERTRRDVVLALLLVASASLLLPPISWVHYDLVLLPALLFAVVGYARAPIAVPWRLAAIAVLLLTLAPFLTLVPAKPDAGFVALARRVITIAGLVGLAFVHGDRRAHGTPRPEAACIGG